MQDRPWVSCVIPTYGEQGIALTKRCLESMIDTHAVVSPEVICVIDGCTDELLKAYAEVISPLGATLLPLRERGGFAKACNKGIRLTNGECVFLINNDIEFLEPSLHFAAEAMMCTNAGLVGIRLLYPDGKVQHGGVYYNPAEEGAEVPGYFDHWCRFEMGMYPGAVTMHNRRLLTGAFLGVRRATFGIIGYLDERFAFSCEDIDLCLRAMEAGQDTLYFGFTAAIHHEGATRGRTLEEKMRLAPDIAQKELESLQFFFRKWWNVDMTGMFGIETFNE